MKLYNLRQSIEKLCGIEYGFPRDFIFLRSVGRCLTRVKSTQENELKVKNYRPPQVRNISFLYIIKRLYHLLFLDIGTRGKKFSFYTKRKRIT